MTTGTSLREKNITPPFIPPDYETFRRKLRRGSPNVNILSIPPEILRTLKWKTGDTIRLSLDEINKRVILQAEHKTKVH